MSIEFNKEDLVSLSKRGCSEIEAIRWCANNIDNVCIDLSSCPSPVALTLYRMCLADSDYKAEFISKIWVKLVPNRASLDDSQKKSADGTAQIDMISRIQKMRDVSVVENPVDKDSEFENSFDNYAGEEDELNAAD